MLDHEQMKAASMENSPPRAPSPVLERAVSPGARSDCSRCSSRASDGEHDGMERRIHQQPHSPVSQPPHSPISVITKPIHNGLTSASSPKVSAETPSTKPNGVELDLHVDRTHGMISGQELSRIRHHQLSISPSHLNTASSNNNNESKHHLVTFEPPRTVTAPSFLIRDILGGSFKPRHDTSSLIEHDVKLRDDEQRICVDDEDDRKLASSRHSPSLLKRHHDDDDDDEDGDDMDESEHGR